MRKRDMSSTTQVPPTPEEFKAIMAGHINISAALNEFWRQCTDDELATWFRDPAQYSYVLRAPNGDIVADGKAKTRDECEEWAIRHAEEKGNRQVIMPRKNGDKVALMSHTERGWAVGASEPGLPDTVQTIAESKGYRPPC